MRYSTLVKKKKEGEREKKRKVHDKRDFEKKKRTIGTTSMETVSLLKNA